MDTHEFFEGVSNPRNKEIMRIFKDLDMVEQLGSGIPRILRSYGKESFVFMNNFTRMVFEKQIGGQIDIPIRLTDRQKDVLDLIRQNNKISRKALSQSLDIAESAVQKHLESLKEKGVIKREGGSRGWWF
jgi:predicted HTH transcriptional regulator